MKKSLNSIVLFLMMISLVAGFSVETNANYEPTRIVQGTPVEGASVKSEGGAFLASTVGLDTNLFNNTDDAVYTWEYTITQGYEEGALSFDTSRFYLSGSFFGKAAPTILYVDQKDIWPATMEEGLEYSLTENKVTFSYTLTADDIDWMNANYGPHLNSCFFRAMCACKKLDGSVEAMYCITGFHFMATKNGVELTEYSKNYSSNFCIDKRTVEIAEAVAPIGADGTVGAYNSNPSKITYLDDNQEAMVKLTLTRPVGVDKSGDNEVNIKIPEGMTYVEGSMSATSANGLTVNLTDSATSPKFSFTGLPVGESVVVTYKLKAGAGNTPVKYDTQNTLTNVKQQGMTASVNNDYVQGAVYSEDEYNTTTTMPLQLNGKHIVTFDSKGGNYTPDDQSVKGGELLTKPTDPTKEDDKVDKLIFDGWYYLDDNGDEKVFDFSVPIRADYDLYAKYTEPKTEGADKPDNAKTGDNMTVYIAAGALSSAAVLLLCIRKKESLTK